MEIIKGVLVQGITEMRDQEQRDRNYLLEEEETNKNAAQQVFTSNLAAHIITSFHQNRDARTNSGMEQEMFDSLRSYNGEYSPEDFAKIKETGGSAIFINLTGVKSRAAASWIRDIQLPAKLSAWSVEPTPVVDLPGDIRENIEIALKEQFGAYYLQFNPAPSPQAAEAEAQQQQQLPAPGPQQQPQQPQQPQQQPQPQPAAAPPAQIVDKQEFTPQPGNTGSNKKAEMVAQTIKEFNQAKRDVEDMLLAEINKIARHEMKRMERQIDDQLTEGNWHRALSDFIDDFTVFPTAFIKGPVITRDRSLTYQYGQPQVNEKYVFLNKRLSPFDMYPSPDATTINDGTNIIEHCRFTSRDLLDMRGLPGYDDEAIRTVVSETSQSGASWLDTGLESDKATEERRGTEWEANRGVIHGLHFHGSVPAKLLKEWQMDRPEIFYAEDEDEFEVEAILAGNHVIRCTLNEHPLKRRPYYKASYQTRPGSFWGRSLPMLMNDLQRMCNAAARALSNNMGLASGPQIELYVDRLADNGNITNIHPFKIWQLTSDPTGAGGRAIQFTQPTSNAAELLKVYQEFEIRADDATGIPRYSYGNERVGGAAQTATGLSMLLESASKAIKDCVRNIDEEVIIPRIEMQFYWNMISNPDLFYTGDPKVVARGSSSLTMKGAEQMRRNEFLQITGNPMDQAIMGLEGRAELLRSIASDLNLAEDLIPSRLELRYKQEQEAKAKAETQQKQFQLEQEKNQVGLKATELQINGQKEMHQGTQQFKLEELGFKERIKGIETQLAMAKLDKDRENEYQKVITDLKKLQFKEEREDGRFNTEVALKLKKGQGI